MGMFAENARENMARAIFKIIDAKIRQNKGDKKLVEILEDLKKQIEGMLL